MGDWSGFTERLRRHAREGYYTFGAVTRGYLDTAANRIEELEGKLEDAETELTRLKAREKA